MASRLTAFKEQLSEQPGRQPRNLLSLLHQLRHELRWEEDQIAAALADGNGPAFGGLMDAFQSYLTEFGFSPSSVSTYRSRLRQLARAYQTFVGQPSLRDTFGERLVQLAQQVNPGSTREQCLLAMAASSGIPFGTLKRWVRTGCTPQPKHYEAIASLSGLLQTDTLALLGTSAVRSPARAKAAAAAHGDDEREPSLYPPLTELPEATRQQLDTLILFKTKARVPPIHRASFQLARREASSLNGGGRWTSTPDGHVASAKSFLQQVDRFFRWAVATQPIPTAQLDTSMLCTVELLEAYIDDCLDNELYGTLMAFLTPLSGLCDPDTGYLTRYHAPCVSWEMADGHLTEAFSTQADWYEQARHLSQQVKSWMSAVRHLSREVNHDAGNNGRRNIDWLLDRPDADLQASVNDLRSMVSDMLNYASEQDDANSLCIAQVATWLALSLEVPLRISNWCAVRWLDAPPRRDETFPCLWHDALSGQYQLRVPRGWLKNRRGREVEQVATTLSHPQATRALVQLGELRQALGWPDPWLFVQTKDSEARYAGGQYTRTALAKAIQTWTERFALRRWPHRAIEKGINPHALRHFVASYVLEKTGDFRLAATALMDSVAVVMSVYGKNDHTTNQRRLSALQQPPIPGEPT